MNLFRALVIFSGSLSLSLACLGAAESKREAEPIAVNAEFVERLLTEAKVHSPIVGAANARVDAASAAAEAVRTWADPTATIGLSAPTSRGFKSSEEGNVVYGVEQTLPLYHRPKLARDVASAEVMGERLEANYVTEKLRRDLTLALVALGLADATLDFAQQDLDWLDATLASVDGRYRVGKATQVEWLKIQTEQAKLVDRLKTLKLEREHRQVELNRLLNRDLHGPWPTVVLPVLPDARRSEEDLETTALQAEPKLKAMQQKIARAKAVARATREQRRPEVGVGVQGRSYTGDAGFREGMVTVNFTLPWLNTHYYESDYARDRARVQVSEEEVADYTLEVREEVHHLAIDLDAADRQTELYRDELIPLTEQTLASASSAWSNGLGSFQDILDARRLLVDHRLMLAQALADHLRLRAELSLLTGTVDLAGLPQVSVPATGSMTMPKVRNEN